MLDSIIHVVYNFIVMDKDFIKSLVKAYFVSKISGSAKEVHIRIGKHYPYSIVCQVLDELEKEGILSSKIVKATKYVRAHYVYTRNIKNKKEPLWKRFLNILKILSF